MSIGPATLPDGTARRFRHLKWLGKISVVAVVVLYMGPLLWHLPLGRAAASSAVAGLIFGLIMAAYFRWKAAQLRLPPWGSYPGA